MSPRVSVVMAAKNYARFLPEAVESVRAQTFTDWELLIIDDGSSDDTPAVVRPFLTDPRVRYFRADRLGQSRAKNLGIGLSRGEFVAFLDADDAWEPTKLEKQLALFTNRPDVGVVFCRRSMMDETGKALARPAGTTPPPRGHVLHDMFVQNFVCFSSAVVRREVFSHTGTFDPQWDLSIDFDLWLRVAKHYAFDYVDEELVRYRTGHGNLSKKLLDRVDTALSIMHRAGERDVIAEVPSETVAAAYASTCRTMAFVLRTSEPSTSAKWYLRALQWSDKRLLSAKGLTAALMKWVSGKREPASPENASVNR